MEASVTSAPPPFWNLEISTSNLCEICMNSSANFQNLCDNPKPTIITIYIETLALVIIPVPHFGISKKDKTPESNAIRMNLLSQKFFPPNSTGKVGSWRDVLLASLFGILDK